MTASYQPFEPLPVPARAGIGLRGDHYADLAATRPPLGFLEIHSENYFGQGGTPHKYLHLLRADYPLSFHGVGLSLGSCDPLVDRHIKRLKELIEIYQPGLISEHLSWGSVNGRFLNDLLPVPYTSPALEHIVRRVEKVQDLLGRQILVENISSYLQYDETSMPEWEFVAEVARRSGCGILLDVNNVYVNACNHGFDPLKFLRGIAPATVREIHLAGHTINTFEHGQVLIDTHNQRVSEPVWQLYRAAVKQFGAVPTLIEWDTDLPELSVLLSEAEQAQRIMDEESHARVA